MLSCQNRCPCADVCIVLHRYVCSHTVYAEVTVLSGQGITIHHSDDKEALPLALHHIPICVTFALFEEAKTAAEVSHSCAC
jgi:exosome complex RNA-binding protein Rrp42 (RNase PH superfamily)